jgi:hypothetical protein
MNKDFSAFDRCDDVRQPRVTKRNVHNVRRISWLAGLALLAVLLLPLAARSVEDRARNAEVAQVQAVEQADPWRAETRRLQTVIAEIRERHPQLNRDQPFYSQALVDNVRDRMAAYIRHGAVPSEALRTAMADVEREGLPAMALVE